MFTSNHMNDPKYKGSCSGTKLARLLNRGWRFSAYGTLQATVYTYGTHFQTFYTYLLFTSPCGWMITWHKHINHVLVPVDFKIYFVMDIWSTGMKYVISPKVCHNYCCWLNVTENKTYYFYSLSHTWYGPNNANEPNNATFSLKFEFTRIQKVQPIFIPEEWRHCAFW